MPHYNEYRCGRCNQITSKMRLYARKVSFTRLGEDRPERTRTREWVCASCLEKDEDWNAPAYSSPGHRSPAQQRIQDRKAGQ